MTNKHEDGNTEEPNIQQLCAQYTEIEGTEEKDTQTTVVFKQDTDIDKALDIWKEIKQVYPEVKMRINREPVKPTETSQLSLESQITLQQGLDQINQGISQYTTEMCKVLFPEVERAEVTVVPRPDLTNPGVDVQTKVECAPGTSEERQAYINEFVRKLHNREINRLYVARVVGEGRQWTAEDDRREKAIRSVTNMLQSAVEKHTQSFDSKQSPAVEKLKEMFPEIEDVKSSGYDEKNPERRYDMQITFRPGVSLERRVEITQAIQKMDTEGRIPPDIDPEETPGDENIDTVIQNDEEEYPDPEAKSFSGALAACMVGLAVCMALMFFLGNATANVGNLALEIAGKKPAFDLGDGVSLWILVAAGVGIKALLAGVRGSTE